MTSPRPPKVLRREAIVAGWTDDETRARALLRNEEPKVRASAFGALVRMGAVTLTDFSVAARDPDWRVRSRLLNSLPMFWSEEVAAAVDLLALLHDPDPVVLELACFVAGECEPSPDGVLERLCDIAEHHEEALCRESAVAALGSLGDQRAKDTILVACTDRATVRRRAVLALAAFEGDDVDEMLVTMSGDVDWQVRQAAEELLAIDGVEF